MSLKASYLRWNYLRVRGEYRFRSSTIRSHVELPPRARRIPRVKSVVRKNGGNYLRVRGEYGPPLNHHMVNVELPPRARRILSSIPGIFLVFGTTSACAENTQEMLIACYLQMNYLRVRGEYRRPRFRETINLELPPRARRIPYRGQG